MPEPAPDTPRPPLLPALRRIFRFARPYAGRLAFAIALTSAGTLISLVVPLGLRALINAVFEEGNRELLNALAFGLFGLFVVQAVVSFAGGYSLQWVGERVVTDLRQRLYRHLHGLGLGYYAEQRVGEITSRLTNDVGTVRTAATDNLSEGLRNVLSFVGSAVLMVALNWRLALVVFSTTPVVVLAARWFGQKVRGLSRNVQDQLADTTAVAEEALANVRLVKAFAREDYEVERYENAVETLFGVARRKAWLTSAFWSGVRVVFLFGLVVIFWYGGIEVLSGRLTAGDLVAFIFYALGIATGVGGLARLYTSYSSAAGASERLFELLDTAPEIEDAPGAYPLPDVRGAVRFDGVTFAYNGGGPVLREVSFEAEPGQTIALVGPSGAGKTTLLNLIPRFHVPQAGRISIDGHALEGVTLASVREQIGVVSQDVQLFGVSIAENIRYGRLDATDAEVRAAARAANAHEFIEAAAEGYDTPIGERGVKLSGGQRQRLAIARALLKDPAILLLDEATSALDAESERLVQEALDRLLKGRTAFVIAHRLATVRDADRILVLDEGRIVQQGTHDALMQQGGLYARLASLQFRDEVSSTFAGEPDTLA